MSETSRPLADEPEYPATTAAYIESLSHSVIDQNERLQRADSIDDAEFQSLVHEGLVEEQLESMREMYGRSCTIPYEGIGKKALQYSAAVDSLLRPGAEFTAEATKIRQAANRAAELSPAIAKRASELAEEKIKALVAGYRPDTASINHLRRLEAALYETYGTAWQVPKVLHTHLPSFSVADIAPAPLQEKAELVPVSNDSDDRIDSFEPAVEFTPDTAVPPTPNALVEPAMAESPVEPTAEAPMTQPEAMPDQATIIDSVLWAVVDYAQKSGAFRMEEMHRDLPELAQLDGREYEYFKVNFQRVQKRITDRLAKVGQTATWLRTGQARGVRYELIISDSVPSQQPVELPTDEDKPDEVVVFERQDPIKPALPEALAVPEGQSDLNAPYVTKAVALLDNLCIEYRTHGVRRPLLAKAIAHDFGIPVDHAGHLVSQLLDRGVLFVSGKPGRDKLITTERPEPKDPILVDTLTPVEAEAPRSREQRVANDMAVARYTLDALDRCEGTAQIGKRALIDQLVDDGLTFDVAHQALLNLQKIEMIAIKQLKTKEPRVVRFHSAQVKRAWSRAHRQFLQQIEERLQQIHEQEA